MISRIEDMSTEMHLYTFSSLIIHHIMIQNTLTSDGIPTYFKMQFLQIKSYADVFVLIILKIAIYNLLKITVSLFCIPMMDHLIQSISFNINYDIIDRDFSFGLQKTASVGTFFTISYIQLYFVEK